MGHLTESDRSLIDMLRDRGILREVVGDRRFDLSQGAILVPCGDGEQFDDLYGHLRDVSLKQGLERAKLHPVCLNGGCLNLPEESPLNDTDREDRVMMKHIAAGRVLKGFHTVLIFAHAPCGAAGLAGLSLEQVIDFTMLGKGRLIREGDRDARQIATHLGRDPASIPDGKVICLFHVDFGAGRRRTFQLSREAWLSWYAERGIQYPAIGHLMVPSNQSASA